MTRSRGFTLIELIISLVLAAVLGVAVVKILVTTSRFYGKDAAIRDARTVARSPVGLIESELLAVEPTGGIVSADSFQITIRPVYAMGVLCGVSGSNAVVSLLPSDSLTGASAGFSGYGYRTGLGAWTYVDGGSAPGSGSAATCTSASVTTLSGGRVVSLSPAPVTGIAIGTPIMLYQRVTYRFAASTAMPGRRALWRDVATGNVSEELAAPYETSARFRFFTPASDTSRIAPASPLRDTRGVELVLDGASERPPHESGTAETTGLTTGVFFRRRSDR